MNIGVYTECLSKPYTGVEVQTHIIVDGLSKTKNEVTCFHSGYRCSLSRYWI